MFSIYGSEGARLYSGRWNTPSSPIIYTSEHYSTAMLEKLVHSNPVLPTVSSSGLRWALFTAVSAR